eukprot:1159637-Pelagomonas_calceolata.AAC.3
MRSHGTDLFASHIGLLAQPAGPCLLTLDGLGGELLHLCVRAWSSGMLSAVNAACLGEEWDTENREQMETPGCAHNTWMSVHSQLLPWRRVGPALLVAAAERHGRGGGAGRCWGCSSCSHSCSVVLR